MTIKIALIGCGWVSNACHGPAAVEYAASHPGVELAACCDIHGERAEAFRALFGFQRAYTDFAAMLDAERPDAVCLAVQPHLIASLGCAILERGIPLLSEKPPGLSVVEIDRLITASKEIIHQAAFNRRFMPLLVELRKRLEGRSIQHLDVQMTRVQRTENVFATTVVHAIDAARFIAGSDYAALNIVYQELPQHGEGVANYILDGNFTGGASAHLSFFPVSGMNRERYTVYAPDCLYVLDVHNTPDVPARLAQYESGERVYEIDAPQYTGRQDAYYLNGFYQEDAAFYDAVQEGVQPACNFTSCRQSVAVMQALIERKASYP
jgi:predicted dehydrogenase